MCFFVVFNFSFYYPRGDLAMSGMGPLTRHLTFDIVINNYLHITNNINYIRLKSESEQEKKK